MSEALQAVDQPVESEEGFVDYGFDPWEQMWRVSPLATAIQLSALDGVPYHPGNHLRMISDALVEATTRAETLNSQQFILVSMPPRHGKSELISRRTPTWYLGNYPKREVIIIGHGDAFAKKWGGDIRNDFKKHGRVLGVEIAPDVHAANKWRTTQGGTLIAAGLHGAVLGSGADLMILDDLTKSAQEAYSILHQEDVWNEWQSTFSSRLYPRSVVIMVMQRWHEKDLIGRMLKSKIADRCMVINLPAVWDSDKPFRHVFAGYTDVDNPENSFPDEVWERHKDDPLWPQLFPKTYLDDKRLTITNEEAGSASPDEYWQSMYQQVPGSVARLGSIYSNFDEEIHQREVERDDRLPLVWTLDFNVGMACSLIGQLRETRDSYFHLNNRVHREVEILDEICLLNAYTANVCDEFLDRAMKITKDRQVVVHLFGDPAGNQRRSSASEAAPNDWVQVRQFLRRNSRSFIVYDHVGSKAPAIRERINTVNTAFRDQLKRSSLTIDPKCKQLLLDMKTCRWKRDANGNATGKQDDADPMRTHCGDALGYMIEELFNKADLFGLKTGFAR